MCFPTVPAPSPGGLWWLLPPQPAGDAAAHPTTVALNPAGRRWAGLGEPAHQRSGAVGQPGIGRAVVFVSRSSVYLMFHDVHRQLLTDPDKVPESHYTKPPFGDKGEDCVSPYIFGHTVT